MYRREKPIALRGSASSLCNNLSILVMPDKRQISYAVVHKYAVNVIAASTDGSSVTARQVICKEPSATQGNPFLMELQDFQQPKIQELVQQLEDKPQTLKTTKLRESVFKLVPVYLLDTYRQTRLEHMKMAKWVQTASRCVMVLTTQRGIQMFEPDGSAMIYWHGLGDTSDISGSNFARGISSVGDNICVGTESGKILVFGIPPKGTNVTLQSTLKGHSSSICDLASDGNTLASGDAAGNILIWNFSGSDAKQATSISGSGSPCNSLRLWKGAIVAGYGSGHLRIFSASSGKISAEVTAHARSVNAIDVASDSGVMLSVSGDSYLRLWQIKPGNLPQIEHKHSEHVTDLQLTGGKFVDPQGRAMCLTGYDHSEIIFYVQA